MKLIGLAALVVTLWLLLTRKSWGASAVNYSTPSPGDELTPPAARDVPFVDSGNSANALDNIGEGIARFEGFYKSGALPQRTNNPGDIGTFGSKVASYSDAGDGWDALNGYITTKAAAHPDWDFYDFFHYYLTGDTNGQPGPNQNPDAMAEYVANYAGVDPTQTVASALGY